MQGTRCPQCGEADMADSVETHLYKKSGLKNVTLRNLKTRRCANCGHMMVAIPKASELHGLLASRFVLKPSRLEPFEIRGLRGLMELTGRALARRLHVEPEQVSRWESENKPQPIGKTSETALRLLVYVSLCADRIPDFPAQLESIALEPPQQPFRVMVTWADGQWRTFG
ncbi:MAG: YgiT-type zinc finger protein [Myxococcota bacterium]